jgi:hypothetical protein
MRERPALDPIDSFTGSAHAYVNHRAVGAKFDRPSPHIRRASGISKDAAAFVEILDADALCDRNPWLRAKLLDLLLRDHGGSCAGACRNIGCDGEGKELCEGSKSGGDNGSGHEHFHQGEPAGAAPNLLPLHARARSKGCATPIPQQIAAKDDDNCKRGFTVRRRGEPAS